MEKEPRPYPIIPETFYNSPELVLKQSEPNSKIIFVKELDPSWRNPESQILVIEKNADGNIVIPTQKTIDEQTFDISQQSEFDECVERIKSCLNVLNN